MSSSWEVRAGGADKSRAASSGLFFSPVMVRSNGASSKRSRSDETAGNEMVGLVTGVVALEIESSRRKI